MKHRLRQVISEGFAFDEPVFGPYSPLPVAHRVTGPAPDKLREIAVDVQQVMNASPMIRTVNADWGTRAPSPHFTLPQGRLRARSP